ncbi:MAG: hypothetical protein ABIJ48_11295 [Actinomycetota bacterium]
MWVIVGIVVVAVAAVAVVFLFTRGGDEGGGTTVAQPTTTSTSQIAAVTSSSSTSATTTSITSSSTTTTTTTLPGPVSVANASWETVSGGVLGGDGGQSVSDVVAIGSGYVAVGISGSDMVWTSPDGIAWTAQPATGLAGALLLHVEAASDGTLVGVGRKPGPQAFAAWTSPDGIDWTMQPPAGGAVPAGGQQVHDLAVYPGGYVAVGSVALSGTDADAAWWTSPDGITWTAGSLAEPGVQQMLSVAVSDNVMVAAGETRPNTGIWTAPVGGTFTRADDPELTTAVSDFDPGNTAARVFAWDVTAGGPGFVAVGADQTTAGTSVAAVWTSSDGSQWTRFGNETEYTPNMLHADFAGRAPWTVMDTVVESGGTLIVVGRTGAPGDPDLIVWESADGFTWRRGAVGILPGRPYAFNALAQDGKLIVVGEQGPSGAGDGAVWVATPDPDTPQTRTWREVPQFESASNSLIWDAITGDDRIVAVGSADDAPAVWESTDGIGWSRLPAPVARPGLSAALESVVSNDGIFLAGGYESGAAIWWSADLSVWQTAATPAAERGDINGIWQGPGQLMAYGFSNADTPVIWGSSDGLIWSDTAVAQPPGLLRFAGVADFAGQIVLIRVDPVSGAPSVWTSSDGRDWTRLPDDPVFTEFITGGVTTFGDRLVIAGRAPVAGLFSAAVLVTADLRSWDLVVLDGAPAPLGGQVWDVSVVGSRLFVTGDVLRDHTYPALWSSGDLIFWTRSEPLPSAGRVNDQQADPGTVTRVVRIGDRLVATGFGWRLADFTRWAAAWTSDNP